MDVKDTDIIEISIIILTKNEERYIGSALDMVFRQKIDKRYEVIVIDSGSEDSTLEIIKNYLVKIIKIKPKEFEHGRTRNLGAQIAEGEIVVFLNADATPVDRYWLKKLINSLQSDEDIVGAYSRIYPRQDCNPLRSWEILYDSSYLYKETKIKHIDNFSKYYRMKPKEKRKLLAFESISCAIRKDILLQYPFEDLDFGEDLEWSKRMMEKGFKIAFEPNSKVLHSHNFYHSFNQTLKKYFDDARLNKRLLNMWSLCNFPLLLGYIGFKVFRDIRYIIRLDKDIAYKIVWLFRSPIIRLAELTGIILGCWNSLIYEDPSSRP